MTTPTQIIPHPTRSFHGQPSASREDEKGLVSHLDSEVYRNFQDKEQATNEDSTWRKDTGILTELERYAGRSLLPRVSQQSLYSDEGLDTQLETINVSLSAKPLAHQPQGSKVSFDLSDELSGGNEEGQAAEVRSNKSEFKAEALSGVKRKVARSLGTGRKRRNESEHKAGLPGHLQSSRVSAESLEKLETNPQVPSSPVLSRRPQGTLLPAVLTPETQRRPVMLRLLSTEDDMHLRQSTGYTYISTYNTFPFEGHLRMPSGAINLRGMASALAYPFDDSPHKLNVRFDLVDSEAHNSVGAQHLVQLSQSEASSIMDHRFLGVGDIVTVASGFLSGKRGIVQRLHENLALVRLPVDDHYMEYWMQPEDLVSTRVEEVLQHLNTTAGHLTACDSQDSLSTQAHSPREDAHKMSTASSLSRGSSIDPLPFSGSSMSIDDNNFDDLVRYVFDDMDRPKPDQEARQISPINSVENSSATDCTNGTASAAGDGPYQPVPTFEMPESLLDLPRRHSLDSVGSRRFSMDSVGNLAASVVHASQESSQTWFPANKVGPSGLPAVAPPAQPQTEQVQALVSNLSTENIDQLTIRQLRLVNRELRIMTSGNKAKLLQRLREFLVERSSSTPDDEDTTSLSGREGPN